MDIRNPGAVIGRSTVGSIQSGLYFGYAAMVRGDHRAASARSWASRRAWWPRAAWPRRSPPTSRPSRRSTPSSPSPACASSGSATGKPSAPSDGRQHLGDAIPRPSYYQTIEEFFVSRRGDPLFLSNADWLLIRKWRGAGIPLRVVLRGIADALDGHAHSGAATARWAASPTARAEVDAAASAGSGRWPWGGPSGLDVAAILAGFARDLEAATAWVRRASKAAAAAAEEIASGRPGKRSPSVESWLAALEATVRARRSARDAGAQRLAAPGGRGRGDLAPYASRMPARVLEQIRGSRSRGGSSRRTACPG